MSSENVRKRKATTKALESNEALTKRLRDNHGGHPSYNTSSTPILSNPPTREGSQATTHNVGKEENSLESEGTETYGEERPNEQTETEDEPEVEDSQSKLDTLFKTFKSPIYVCFHPPKFVAENGQEFQVFQCSAKNCTARDGRLVKRNINTQNATSTSNLKKHALKCWGEELVKAVMAVRSVHEARAVLKEKGGLRDGSILAAFQKAGHEQVTYSNRALTNLESRVSHVKWICESYRPFSLVADQGYHRNMKTGPGRQHIYIPSPSTAARDVKRVFYGAVKKISEILQSSDSRLHFATDCWTSPNYRAYMAVTVQYEIHGRIHSWLLDIRELAHRHSGVALAAEFLKVLNDFGITDKILAVTCDNATNNDVMVEKMGEGAVNFDGDTSRVRCFAHIVNLVAKSILSQFDLPKNQSNSETAHQAFQRRCAEEEDGLRDLDIETDEETRSSSEGVNTLLAGGNERLAGDLAGIRRLAGTLEHQQQRQRLQEAPEEIANDGEDMGWIDERWGMSENELGSLTQSVMPARRMLVKLRKIAFAVKNSPTVIAPRWNEICTSKGLKKRHIPTDVKTRWNSTHDLLDFSLKYQAAIDILTKWGIATHLCKILKVFKDATLFFSKTAASTITAVIPAMDHFDEVLTTAADSPDMPPSIRAAIRLGLRTLNRYYDRTDHSKIYRIAMVLDPRYKTSYFRKLKWEEDWITTSINLVKTEFAVYASLEVNVEQNDDVHSALLDNPQLHFEVDESSNIFEDFITGGPAIAASSTTAPILDEVELYLSSGPEVLKYMDNGQEKTFTPLEWWVNHRSTYPRLSRMALDYLSVPPTSVDVERVFSKGRMVLSYLRNRLTPTTTRGLLCINEWSSKGLLPEKDMLEWIRNVQEKVGESEDEYE
ncbi:hypothetical protein Agabi119p4_8288 [Agaricus bisporus var. burnettii]|uniref:HAT C-terminal dimerisation domain-containing protein n=1 Tax=Agaricus bisporus var. burnettii TaxID=192524 RepID=A0A8H7C6B0_AGABI|nr:hypothetical protein Agabi119p4_8288 [Agaricus bisporus var. burnettii]